MHAKIYGPYPHRDGWRCYLRSSTGDRVWCPTGRTEQAAIELARVELDEFRAAAARTVGDLIEDYLAHLQLQGRKQSTLQAAAIKLQLNHRLSSCPHSKE